MLAAAAPAASSNVVFSSNYVRPVINGGTVALIAAAIKNNSNRASGPLRLELWASSAPFSSSPPPMSYKLAQFQLGVLKAGQQYVNVGSPTMPLGTPPDGSWFYVVFLTEFTGSSLNDDGYIVDDWVVAPEPFVVGPPVAPPPSSETAVAVEYLNNNWGFYFVTAAGLEIEALDNGVFGSAWQRTGESFRVWPAFTAGSTATCRFFSTGFAPRSTHFYTPLVSECDALKSSPAWAFEGIVFNVALPDSSGGCPPGTVPLYRAYNNGIGGAPNHRFTTSFATLEQMLAIGWSFEGDGNTKVFACVPH
jgi:hypothetical protein